MLSDQGQCSALLTREGFFDFIIFRTHCNVSHNFAVVCQHDQIVNTVFSNNISDIKVLTAHGFYNLQVFSSCDIGWFMVDNMCINFYHCPHCFNNIQANEQCRKHNGQLAHHILNNVTINIPGNTLAKNTELALFWDMFHEVGDVDLKRYDWDYFYRKIFIYSVNASGMCINLNMSDPCIDNNIVLSVSSLRVFDENALVSYYNDWYYNDRPDTTKDINILQYRKMWAVITQISFKLASYRHLTLCEKFVVYTRTLTECSDLYTVCDDGTCVHDSLVCDGKPHCLLGEDEADCEHICSDLNHNCMYHCHHRDLCSCSPDYFQCISGGCTPLQKLCDKIMHCVNASDEPPTCVYL